MAAPLNAGIREKILAATSRLLEARSFAHISLAEIAKAAGISKGTLYYYYNSKEALLFDIVEQYMSRLAYRLESWITDKSKDTSYRRLLRYAFQCGIYDQSGNLRLHLLAAAVAGDDSLREKLLQKYAYFHQVLAAHIHARRPGVDAGDVAWMVLTMMDGLLMQNQLQNPDFSVDDAIENAVALIEKIG